MLKPEKRKVLYYLPWLVTESALEFSNFKIIPFSKDSEYGKLLPENISIDRLGSLIEPKGFKNGVFYSLEIDEKVSDFLEELKFGYFFYNPSYAQSFFGYVSSESFECFRFIEPNQDTSFEHKELLSNGMYSFWESTNTYYETRNTSKRTQILMSSRYNSFPYVDYLSECINNEKDKKSLLDVMRMYNRCWATYSLNHSIDKPLLARISIEGLVKKTDGKLKSFIEKFVEVSFKKLEELSESDAIVKRLTEFVVMSPKKCLYDSVLVTSESIAESAAAQKKDLSKVIEKYINHMKNVRNGFVHDGVDAREHINMPFYLLWFPLCWIVFLHPEKITADEGIRLALFFGLLKRPDHEWQQLSRMSGPKCDIYTLKCDMETYDYYSRCIPKWRRNQDKKSDLENALKMLSKWFKV